MKRAVTYIILTLCICYANAQIQQGIVKTRGRMVNGQLVAGTKLSGATITLNFGNSLVSGNQGAFSFNVPTGKNYSLVTATKQGYTLADPEYTRRSFSYSASNPFYVVLEDENQRQADINAATRKVRRTLTAQLQAREDEIEALKEQNKLTEEEYQERLKQLYDKQSKSEQLVKEMAERYASTDYDQLDEFNRQVQMYIEEGELQKADSMIRSKGGIEQRVTEYHNIVKANKQERTELDQREAQLNQSEAGAAKAYEDLSQDLYRRHEIFLQQALYDSALYCMKIRADLDSTNVSAAWQYATLCYNQKQFIECEKYYLICSRYFAQSENDANAAFIHYCLGALYFGLGAYENCYMHYYLALDYYEQMFKQKPEIFQSSLAMTQSELGVLYMTLKDYERSKMYNLLAIENLEHLFELNPNEHRGELARTQNNLGKLYYCISDIENCEKYYKLAIQNYELLSDKNLDFYRIELAGAQSSLASLYSARKDYINSVYYYELALKNFETIYQYNPGACCRDYAVTQIGLGNTYRMLKDYEKSADYLLLANEKINYLYERNPDAYREDMAYCLSHLGTLFYNTLEYKISIVCFEDAEVFYEQLFNHNQNLYKQSLINNQNSLAYCYALDKKFEQAIELIDKSISLKPDDVNLYSTKGEIFMMQGMHSEALEMWNKMQKIEPDYLINHPKGTNFLNGLKKLGLIE